MSVLQKLTEGVQSRDMQAEGAALLNKWEATGLLEGLNSGQQKQGMAVLLENQAKELLREASSMAAGDVEGFAAVAFPIVRRVFGGLIANDLISVQPMSLPSGLIFFLDFVHEGSMGGAEGGASIYGGNVVGKDLIKGVDLAGANAAGPGGHFEFGHGHAQANKGDVADGGHANVSAGGINLTTATDTIPAALTGAAREGVGKVLRYDADVFADTTLRVQLVDINIPDDLDRGKLAAVTCEHTDVGEGGGKADPSLIRRLTQLVDTDGDGDVDKLRLVFARAGDDFTTAVGANLIEGTLSIPFRDQLKEQTGGVGSVIAGVMPLEEPEPDTGNASHDGVGASANAARSTKNEMQEIDIKVDSIAVTAQTKKLKAKWSPELGQDLNAYHNLDAEVELTGILSEQIALEIDRELLSELVEGATAGTRYWSRAPGLFVDANGAEVGYQSAAPDFTGTVSEWYETLIETINDVSAQIHRKTLRGGANFVVCSPEVANILEFTSGFRASVTADQDRGTIGAVRAGSLSKKFDVYVDPYFLRNVILVGRKGSSFLESGYVYAPYVPLQVTPTIFGTEDFVPRKGVMTRYAKKMVRPDMYGLVVVRGLLGESGRSA